MLNTPYDSARPDDNVPLNENTPIIHENIQFNSNLMLLFNPAQEFNQTLCSAKEIIRYIAFGVSSLSGIPFIPIARAAVSNQALGYILAGNVVFSFAVGSSWGWQNIIRKFDQDNDLALSQNQPNKIKCLIVPLSILSGALTSIPSTYLAYIYNAEHRFWVIFNYVDALGLHSFGFGELYRYLFSRKNKLCDFRENESLTLIDQAKHEFEIILHAFNNLLNSDLVLYKQYRTFLDQSIINTSLVPSAKIALLIDNILTITLTNQPILPALYKNGYPLMITRMVCNAIFPTASTIVNGLLAYGSVSLFTDKTPLIILFTFAITITSAMIDFYANNAIYTRVFSNFYHYVNNNYQSSLIGRSYKNLYLASTAIIIISGIVAALSAMPSLFKALTDLFNTDSQWLLVPAILALVAQCISKLYMSFDLVQDVFNLYLKNYGSPEEKTIHCDLSRLNQFLAALNSSNRSGFVNLWNCYLTNEHTNKEIVQQGKSQALARYSLFARQNIGDREMLQINQHTAMDIHTPA